MTLRIGISGLGRIGRMVLRAALQTPRPGLEVALVNDTADPEIQAHLLEFDSTHGRWAAEIAAEPGMLSIDGRRIATVAERDPGRIPWGEHGVDIVLDCTGAFRKGPEAQPHLTAGARKVLISAPTDGEDRTVVYGVNHGDLTPQDRIVSCASCTTNCLAPLAMVMDQAVGIRHGFMTTIHAFTSDQRLLDNKHKDLHRARTATSSMIPTSTGAAKSVARVLPRLKGRLDGVAIRVPVPNVSLVDFKFEAERATTVQALNTAVLAAAAGPLHGVLGSYDKPLVSIDFNHDDRSAVYGLNEAKVIDGTFVRVMAWYDNEWAFSCRMLDVAQAMHAAG